MEQSPYEKVTKLNPTVKERSSSNLMKMNNCKECEQWTTKMKDLTWSYQCLIQTKDQQISQLQHLLQKIELQNNSNYHKLQIHINRNRKLEGDYQQLTQQNHQQDHVIHYFKQREVELLAQLKTVENQLYLKSVQVKDNTEDQDQKHIEQLTETVALNLRNDRSRANILAKQNIYPFLDKINQNSESLGKLLSQNIGQLEKVNQEKMILELKHRMALLRAIELSILK